MKLDDDAIKEFRALYFAEFGVELSVDEARAKAGDLLSLVKLIYRLD